MNKRIDEMKFYKCGECEKCFQSENMLCPKCRSTDCYELEEIKSKTNWNYVNACFKGDY